MSKATIEIDYKVTRTTDTEHAAKIMDALKKGNYYCPCAILKTKDTRCMCKEFVESDKEGPCRCGLYIKSLRNAAEVAAYMTPLKYAEENQDSSKSNSDDISRQ